jgi:hypothetical protein
MLEDEIFNKVFEEKLFFPDIRNPKNILDCGYGRATWAVKVAERYENCNVGPRCRPESPLTFVGHCHRHLSG